MKNHFMTPSFSIKIPCWKILHFKSGKKVGESRPACFKGFAHYDHCGRAMGKSMRNIVGDLIHYDTFGNMREYCQHTRYNMIAHYDLDGKQIGHSFQILGIVYFHKLRPIRNRYSCNPKDSRCK